MELSIVSTMYHSQAYVSEFCRRVKAAAEAITDHYEVILVDDGSPDASLEIARDLQREDDRLRIIELSRNFGHHKAIMTGLAYSRGTYVFLIDCDLEEAPELLTTFWKEIETSRADVVYGVQDSRSGSFFRRLSGHLFYRIFNLLSDYPVPFDQCIARLMNRSYVDSLLQHEDRNVFLAGLMAITGYKQIPVAVQKTFKGTSTYSLKRRMTMAIDAITSFSAKPLSLMCYLGGSLILVAGAAGVYLLVCEIVCQRGAAGWLWLIISTWLLGGIVILCLGTVGLYLYRLFMEVKKRPYTVIRAIYSTTGNEAAVRDSESVSNNTRTMCDLPGQVDSAALRDPPPRGQDRFT